MDTENKAPDLKPNEPDPEYTPAPGHEDDEPGEAPDQQADASPRNDRVPE